jgi:hypothetical protein
MKDKEGNGPRVDDASASIGMSGRTQNIAMDLALEVRGEGKGRAEDYDDASDQGYRK